MYSCQKIRQKISKDHPDLVIWTNINLVQDMKTIKLILCILFLPLVSFSQGQAIEDGDYIALTPGFGGHYVFKDTRQVYYNYDPDMKMAESKYQITSGTVEELFFYADSIKLASLKGVDENHINQTDSTSFRILEYKIGGTASRICWDAYANNELSWKLNGIVGIMNRLW
jgi:hypothetical protein